MIRRYLTTPSSLLTQLVERCKQLTRGFLRKINEMIIACDISDNLMLSGGNPTKLEMHVGGGNTMTLIFDVICAL